MKNGSKFEKVAPHVAPFNTKPCSLRDHGIFLATHLQASLQIGHKKTLHFVQGFSL